MRRPLVRAALNGAELGGILSARVDSNNHLAADRFSLTLAARAQPVGSVQVPGARLSVQMGVDGSWANAITGVVDAITYNPIAGVIEVEGRDLAALLIEAQLDELFSNRTASEIARLLAARHGLGADVGQTNTAVGRYYQSERDKLALSQFAKVTTEWDLLALLATYEGFDLYVEGTTLCFREPDPSLVQTIAVSDCIDLRLGHCVGLARPVSVTVNSWSASAGSTAVAALQAPGIGPVLKRTVSRPNLTQDDAARLAARTIADIKRHEWSASVHMPGDLLLSPRSRVQLVGSQSAWDRSYTVSQISRSLDARRGFTQFATLQGL